VIIGGGIVLLACLAWILYGERGVLPPYVLALVMGIASGAAMLPYTVIKEANPPQYGGTATGVINFLNFTFSALLGPVFGWLLVAASGGGSSFSLEHYRAAFEPLLYGVALAIVFALLLKETGPATHRSPTPIAADLKT
jgi:MFS family permease